MRKGVLFLVAMCDENLTLIPAPSLNIVKPSRLCYNGTNQLPAAVRIGVMYIY